MDMLTRNMRELIIEVKQESKQTQKMKGFDIEDVFAAMKAERDKQAMKERSNQSHDTDKNSTESSRESHPDLNREEFGRLMEKVGLGEDIMLLDKLFWIFDEDGSGNIGHKELGIGLEMLKDNTFEQKLDVFFDLCDDDNSGTVDKREFYNLLRLNATTSYEDRDRLKFYVN